MADIETRFAQGREVLKAAVEAAKRAEAALLAVVMDHHGLTDGCLIKTKAGVGKLTRILYFSSLAKPWVYVHLLKKDGTPSAHARCAYDDWELVPADETNA